MDHQERSTCHEGQAGPSGAVGVGSGTWGAVGKGSGTWSAMGVGAGSWGTVGSGGIWGLGLKVLWGRSLDSGVFWGEGEGSGS